MKSATGNRFSIIPQGGLKEEYWEWTAIEEMCRAGKLSPQSLIFIPEENAWHKLSESKLAACFPKSDGAAGAKAAPLPETTGHREEYDRLLEQIRTSPGDAGLRVTAAEIALAMGKTERARDHFQEALEIQPYHPRVAQEAKRNLPPSAVEDPQVFGEAGTGVGGCGGGLPVPVFAGPAVSRRGVGAPLRALVDGVDGSSPLCSCYRSG